jgi:urate oxidase
LTRLTPFIPSLTFNRQYKLYLNMPQLSAARYGKDNIRVYKVERDEATKTHTVVEMTVCVLLEGEIETS